jgi:chromosome segregation ATPase
VLPQVQAGPEERRNWKPRAIAAGVVALLLAIALALAVVAWQMERSAHHKASDELSASRAQVESLQSRLTETRSRLQRTQALSARQQAILRRTAAILASVDPLLTGADELQQLTSGIQDDRDNFSYASQQLVDDLITLGNDVINGANAAGVDLSYLSGEIDNVNSEIDNVRAAADTLASSDTSYGAASDRFGNRASSFTAAVRALQRELRKLKAQ